MIEHIKTKGFKGFDINEPVYLKTIYFGGNRSGKSSRAHAIALTIIGYVPFAAKTSKIASNILNDFGVGDSLTAAIKCNGVEFERHFSRNNKGAVSQRMRVDKKKVSASDYAVALSHAGNPKIVDVNDFMQLSDQKKIDLLFTLFPPGIDFNDIENKIEKAKTLKNDLQAKESTFLSVIQRLTASKSLIELPSGSLSETRAEIERLTIAVKKAQDNLKQIEIDEAKEAARVEQKNDSQSEFDRIMESNEDGFDTGKLVEQMSNPNEFHLTDDGFNKLVEDHQESGRIIPELHGSVAEKSIQKIIDTMQDAECSTCAAMIVAKVELKKLK